MTKVLTRDCLSLAHRVHGWPRPDKIPQDLGKVKWNTVREAVGELLYTSCKTQTNANYTTWKHSASLGLETVVEARIPIFVLTSHNF